MVEAFRSGSQFVLVQAPPGVGKTAVAMAVARSLSADQTIYLTATKQLQDQYLAMENLVDVRGRANFACKIEPVLRADWGICTFGEPCEYAGVHGDAIAGCAYWDQKRAAIQSREVVTNYAYGLRTMEDFRPSLVVCDEAHEIPHELASWLSRTLDRRLIHAFVLPTPPSDTDTEAWKAWSKEVNIPAQYDRKLQRQADSVAEFVKCLTGPGERLVIQEPGGWRVTPVWAGMHAGSTLLQWAPQTLIMSATVLDPYLFTRSLGVRIGSGAATFFDVASPFPPERRPLRLRLTEKVNANMSGEQLAHLVSEVDQVLGAHPDEKGIIHAVSYRLAQEVMRRSRFGARLLTHDAKNREDVFMRYRRATHGAVLVSPSAGVGVDFPYDGVRFQIILKLPFPDRSDPVRVAQAKSDIGKQLSIYDTASALVQAYGRAMRAEDDWGVTYLLDANWGWFRHVAKRYLPIDVLKAVRRTDELGPLKEVA